MAEAGLRFREKPRVLDACSVGKGEWKGTSRCLCCCCLAAWLAAACMSMVGSGSVLGEGLGQQGQGGLYPAGAKDPDCCGERRNNSQGIMVVLGSDHRDSSEAGASCPLCKMLQVLAERHWWETKGQDRVASDETTEGQRSVGQRSPSPGRTGTEGHLRTGAGGQLRAGLLTLSDTLSILSQVRNFFTMGSSVKEAHLL